MPQGSKGKRLTAKQVQAIARALADPTRFEILKYIAGQEQSACTELRQCTSITAATLSHHLKELEAAGLVETSKRGKFVDVEFSRSMWSAYLVALAKI